MVKAIDRNQLTAEHKVAKTVVLPYLTDYLKWPRNLIRGYGRVPIELGRSTVWADFVLYIADSQRASPWLLVEVKRRSAKKEDSEDAVSQAESYSLVLRTPFFCVTDGEEADFYLTGSSQGRSVRLAGPPPRPSEDHLPEKLETVWFSPRVDKEVDEFFVGLKNDDRFFRDTQRDHEDLALLKREVLDRLDNVSPQKVKEILHEMNLKTRMPNLCKISRQIDADFPRFRRVLKRIRDLRTHTDDEVTIITSLLDKSKRGLHIGGVGMFFISQLLAAANPTRYLVVHDKEVKALRKLGLMDLLVSQDTAEGYVYVCDVCRQLFERKMKDRLAEHGFGLAAVANFLYHYHEYYCPSKKWSKPSARCKVVGQPSADRTNGTGEAKFAHGHSH